MSYTIVDTPNASSAETSAVAAAHSAFLAGRTPIIITTGHDDVEHIKKGFAGAELLGTTITTLPHWVADLWELFGDGRTIVNAVERETSVMRCVCEQGRLGQGSGTVSTLSRIAREALPRIRAVSPTVDSLSGITEGEAAVISILVHYSEMLSSKGMLEYSDALEILSPLLAGTLSVYVVGIREDELSCAERTLFASAGATLYFNTRTIPDGHGRTRELTDLLSALFDPDPTCPITPRGALRFLFPAGKSACEQALVDTIVELAAEFSTGDIVVVCKDAERLHTRLAGRLSDAGIGCAHHASKPFVLTDAGRAITQIISLLGQGESFDTFLAADYALGRFSDMGNSSAFWCEEKWRGNRLIDLNEVLTDLACRAGDTVQGVIGSFENGRATEALAIMTKFAAAHTMWPPAYRSEQLAAISSAAEYFEAGARAGLSYEDILALLTTCKVPSSGAVCDARVRFMPLDEAATLPPCSCAALVVANLNSIDYPVVLDDGADGAILEKIGADTDHDALTNMRANLYDALSAASHVVVCERVLNDNGNPTYPTVLFEEIVDCYRFDPTDDSELDDTGITESLAPYATRVGEDAIFRNATGKEQQVAAAIEPWPPLAIVSDAGKRRIALPRLYADGVHHIGLDLSPSQIESYLECPYQWFAKRRLALASPDEGAGPMERGTFVHVVLKRFYQRFRELGFTKVLPDLLPQAKTCMEEVFREQAQREYDAKPQCRYVPVGEIEVRQRETLLRELIDYLDREAILLPSFEPRHFEWDYGKEEPFSYAGCNIVGTIDRIDVEKGTRRAVVIDYKTGLSDDYNLCSAKADENFSLPRKMQALIYARVVQELLGYRVVAALYINPLAPDARGAFDATIIDGMQIPGIKPDRNRVPNDSCESFADLLEKAEAAVAVRLDALAHGGIEPDPLSNNVCKYCPVILCEKRLS